MSKQFTESDRAVLAELLRPQFSKNEIASRLKKHRSSVYRLSRVGAESSRVHRDRSAPASQCQAATTSPNCEDE